MGKIKRNRGKVENTNLRNAIKDSGLSMAEIARRLGITRQSMYETVRSELTPRTLVRILQTIGWSDDIIWGIPLGHFYDLPSMTSDLPPMVNEAPPI